METVSVRELDCRRYTSYHSFMNDALPGWIVDDRESVRREAEPYRHMTPEQRAELLAAACRSMARLLRIRDNRDRVLAHTDPLPESTIRALDRLRREAARTGREPGPDHD